jgi:hypothetical protein
MPDGPIEAGDERGYPGDMEARLRVLEEIAAGTKAILAEIRADQRVMRAELTAGLAAARSESTTGFASLRAEMIAADQRRERDFRLAFGALITTSFGLAYLIAHAAHWL